MKKEKNILKSKKLYLTGILIMGIISIVYSQNIAITDDDGYNADGSAMLDVKSTSKGLLIPRMDSSQRVSITSPATGLLVFDTDDNAFFYYNGSTWLNLSSTVVNPDLSAINNALFSVLNNNGDTVFAVYPEGVQINVGNGDAKGNRGGFAVGGLASGDKAPPVKFLHVSSDSVRVYVDTATTGKGNRGGFAVGGFSSGSKGITNDYLHISDDSVRVYIVDPGAKGNRGGFAVGGLSSAKTGDTEFLKISSDANPEMINPSEPRFLWYPTKNAFLAGQVLIADPADVGLNSLAIGYETKAQGNWSQSLGYQNQAVGDYSTAIGKNSVANYDYSFAVGEEATANALNSYAFGRSSEASGSGSYAFGWVALASGPNSFALGRDATSSAESSVAMGRSSTASGSYSAAIGYNVLANQTSATALGYAAQATGNYAIAIGRDITSSNTASIAMGQLSTASGNSSTAIGYNNNATHTSATALGYENDALANYTSVLGYQSEASGTYATAIGYRDTASGDASTAIGRETRAIGNASLALGDRTEATAYAAVAIGLGSVASGGNAVAIGRNDTASGFNALAMGIETKASGDYALSMNAGTQASGYYSAAFGNGTNAQSNFEFVIGRYNDEYSPSQTTFSWSSSDRVFVIGNGSSDLSRSNALTVLKAGRVGIQSVTAPTYALELPNSTSTGVGKAQAYAWDTYSDKRVKSEIKTLHYGLNELMKLKPVSYRHHNSVTKNGIINIEKSSTESIGFIAQDVYEIIPEAVTKPENEEKSLWSMSYEKLVPVLIKAVQEQQETIENMQKEIDRLNNR